MAVPASVHDLTPQPAYPGTPVGDFRQVQSPKAAVPAAWGVTAPDTGDMVEIAVQGPELQFGATRLVVAQEWRPKLQGSHLSVKVKVGLPINAQSLMKDLK